MYRKELLVLPFIALLSVACGGGEGAASGGSATAPAAPAVGDSCAALAEAPAQAWYGCVDNKKIFCSALTKDKFEPMQDMFQCGEGETCTTTDDKLVAWCASDKTECTVAEDHLSVKCVAK